MTNETCAQCGHVGPVGTHLVPYLVDRKVLEAMQLERTPGKPFPDVVKPARVKLIHRWLCGVQTGRNCAEVWHEKWRAWKRAQGVAAVAGANVRRRR